MTPTVALALAHRRMVCGPGCAGDPDPEDEEVAAVMIRELADCGFHIVSIGINSSEPRSGKNMELRRQVAKAVNDDNVEIHVIDPKGSVR